MMVVTWSVSGHGVPWSGVLSVVSGHQLDQAGQHRLGGKGGDIVKEGILHLQSQSISNIPRLAFSRAVDNGQ